MDLDQDSIRDMLGSAWIVAPTPSIIYHVSGQSVMINTVGRKLFGYSVEDTATVQEHYNLYTDASLIRINALSLIKAAFSGKKVQLDAFEFNIVDKYARPTDRWLHLQITVAPLRVRGEIGEYIVAYYVDQTEQAALETQIQQNQQVLDQASAQQSRLMEEIEARSAPVVPIFAGILVMPLIGALDSLRAQNILSSALEQATEHAATTLILDITGVPVVDTLVANYLLQAIRALRLVGTETILVGISPEIAQTMVQLGLRLEDITTRADLQSGLQAALKQQGLAIKAVA